VQDSLDYLNFLFIFQKEKAMNRVVGGGARFTAASSVHCGPGTQGGGVAHRRQARGCYRGWRLTAVAQGGRAEHEGANPVVKRTN
jgi:hypothetical protein